MGCDMAVVQYPMMEQVLKFLQLAHWVLMVML
jgi:hypothetical protein